MDQAQAEVLKQQIGIMNILSISGGRTILNLSNGTLYLPVSNGYRVQIELDEASDTYTVRRIFRRSSKDFVKGEVTGVYCDQVGEVAYEAGMFRSGEFPQVAA
jgi:hypothetical protein